MWLSWEAALSQALSWGIVVASVFPIEAPSAIFINYPNRIKADIAAFGEGPVWQKY